MSSGSSYRKQLSRPVLVAEALRLLDEEGPAALTMRNLADRLGVVPNALYRHVKDKDDLLDGVMNEAVALVPIPSTDLGWEAGLTALAENIRATMLEHPPMTDLVVNRPNLGMAALHIGEYGFAVTLAAGFAPADAERAVNLVLTYVLGFVALEVPRIGEPVATKAELDRAYDGLPEGFLPNTEVVRPDPIRIISAEQFHFGLARVVASLRPLAGAEGAGG